MEPNIPREHIHSRIRSRIIEIAMVYRSSDIGPRVASYMASRYFRWERWQDFSFLNRCFFDRDLRRERENIYIWQSVRFLFFL